jgi:hypothetical protein
LRLDVCYECGQADCSICRGRNGRGLLLRSILNAGGTIGGMNRCAG